MENRLTSPCQTHVRKAIKRVLMFLCLGLWPFLARADLPDPIEFDWAIESNQIDKVRGWLDEGLSPEFQGQSMGTGLMVAAWHGNVPMMQLFFDRGANPRRVNKNGEQALQLAAWHGHLDAVKWLIEHGAILNRDPGRWSGLHYAVFNGHREVAQFLIERGADIDAPSPNGSTPLMLAAREGREEIARILFDAGANTRPQNDWGDTALSMAVRYKHSEIGQMISTPEEFERAVRQADETLSSEVARRSEPAPANVNEVLKKESQVPAESTARAPTPPLPPSFRRPRRVRVPAAAPKALRPQRMIISAKRASPGQERVRILTQPTASPPTALSPESREKIVEIVRQLHAAQAQGRPTDALRKQLYEAVKQGRSCGEQDCAINP